MFFSNFISKALFDFLDMHCDPARPLLLGLSGGPDSLALLHLLLDYKQSRHITLGIAHVDHGWREESNQEARILEQNASALGLPFHLKKLYPELMEGNLEASCRHARLQFFSELCQNYHYQAVVLGHHAGDQIETVLKRIFEGAGLANLGGLKEITRLEDLTLWRPLLKFPKKEILALINQLNLSPFNDRTNLDPCFLRGRMRTSILPFLSKEFGKNIENSIEKLGEESKELTEYLDFKLNTLLSKIEKSPRGLLLDLSHDTPHAFEVKQLIRKITLAEACVLSRVEIEKAASLIIHKVADKKIVAGRYILQIDRGRLFMEKFTPSMPCPPFQIHFGNYTYGDWKVEAKPSIYPNHYNAPTWKDVWDGACQIWLPKGDYHFAPVSLHANYPGNSSIYRWWTNAKVPAFLRPSVPLIWQGNQVQAEFLSGKKRNHLREQTEGIAISLNIKIKDHS